MTNVTSVTSWGPLHQTGDKGGCDRLSVSASNVQKEHIQVTSTSNYFRFRRGIFIVVIVKDSFTKKVVTLIKVIER